MSRLLVAAVLAATALGVATLSAQTTAKQGNATATAPADMSVPEIASGDGPEPAIHGPRVVGTTPGKPFLFLIPATGEGKLEFSAQGLPAGLTLDGATGIITGTVKAEGQTPVTLEVKGPRGKATRKLTVVAGRRKLALTPPMGWNSWNVWAGAVSADKVKAAADAMVKSGLAAKGFSYVNIDDCWESKARDEKTSEIAGNDRFRDMKGLCDYVHAKGLKIGLYSSPGPKTCASYLGSYQYEELDARTWAKWGFDYIKYDWCSYGSIAPTRKIALYAAALGGEGEKYRKIAEERDQLGAKKGKTPEELAKFAELKANLETMIAAIPQEKRAAIDLEVLKEPYRTMRAALDKADRDIVYSLCQYGMGNVSSWGGDPDIGGNCWRTTGDIRDSWGSMSGIGFKQDQLSKYVKPGQWNDPDMLVVGKVGWGPRLHPTKLTPNEQLTHITLWCMVASPLLIGCDMTDMDKFTTDVLTNTEVLDVNQDPLGRAATKVAISGETEVWARPLFDETVAVALFNRGKDKAEVKFTVDSIANLLPAARKGADSLPVRDLWKRKDAGEVKGDFSTQVPSHGAVLLKVGKPVQQ